MFHLCTKAEKHTALKSARKQNTYTKHYKDVCIQACWLYKHYALMHKTETNCLGVCIANRWSLFVVMYKILGGENLTMGVASNIVECFKY